MNDPSLDAIFGSTSATRVLLFLENYGSAYATRIARAFGMSVSRARAQLEKYEAAGLLVSRSVGRSRVFEWNPRSQRVPALRAFLRALLDSLPRDTVREFFRERQRPRRQGKR